MKQTMTSIAIIVISSLVIFNLLMYRMQEGMIFFPVKDISQTPHDWGLEYENVEITTDDKVRLHGWYIPSPGSGKALLFFHGNAGNISHRGDSVRLFHRLGLNVLIIDYRGYGNSQGKTSEKGLYMDADAAWRYLAEAKKFRDTQIIIFGRSLGGAVASKLAAKVKPGGLILESTFSSARDMARQIFSFLSYAIHLRYTFPTADNVRQVQAPVLVLHSPDDEIIPYASGLKVYASANAPKHFIEMRGDHNYGFIESQPEYEIELGKWLSRIPDQGN